MNRAYEATRNEAAQLEERPDSGSPPAAAPAHAGVRVGGRAGVAGLSIQAAGQASPPAALIREGAELKSEIDGKTARLRQINLRLAKSARFKSGQKTAYLVGAGYKVKIRLHENIAWDQEKILRFREYLPEKKFAELFKAVYEPMSKKAIDGFIAHADKDLSNGLKWCMDVKPGAPQVTYEKLSGEE